MNTRPDFAFVVSHPAHLVAFGFGAGLAPVAPGTAGTLVALPAYWLIKPFYSDLEFLVLTFAAFVLGVWACERTGRALGIADYGGMVWDEIVAFWLVLLVVPATIASQLLAFALFRLFDIAKPQPIRHFDATMKGGFGVMFDDLVAAFYVLLVFAIYKFIDI